MKQKPLPLVIALAGAVILTAAMVDAAAIVTRPLWPLFAWMLP